MPGENDDRIEAVIREAADLISALNLTPDEEIFASDVAKRLHEEATTAYLCLDDEGLGKTRALSAAAAVALALVTVKEWARKVDSDFRPGG